MNTEPDYHGNLVACLPAVFIFTVFCCFMYDNGFLVNNQLREWCHLLQIQLSGFDWFL